MLDGKVTDMLEAQALLYHNQHVDIYSASWGPKDDGKTMEGPGTYVRRALIKGVMEVRHTERGLCFVRQPSVFTYNTVVCRGTVA